MELYPRFLWEAGVAQIRTAPPWFQWSSGIESPIYVDHRRLLAHPTWRRWVVETLAKKLSTAGYTFRAVVGIATGGIAWAAWLGDYFGLPVGYVRPQPKVHGLSRRVEGLTEPTSVLLIEDLISTGQSSHRVAAILREEGFHVAAVAALWTYDLPSDLLKAYPVICLLSFPHAIAYWQKIGFLSSDTIHALRQWHKKLSDMQKKE